MGRDKTPTDRALAVSNEQAFDIYRRMVEADLSRPYSPIDTGSEWGLRMQMAAKWMARYPRRRDLIQGEPGWGHTLADAAATEALIARNLAKEAEHPQLPPWDEMTLRMVEQSLKHIYQQRRIDVSSLAEHCRFGPSLRRLWSEAKARGMTDDQAWSSIVDWAYHRPPVWNSDDARKRRKLTLQEAGPGNRLDCPVIWQKTDDVDFPWTAECAGETWKVRINDFPDEHMYTLFVNGEAAGDFDNWPDVWDRGDRQGATALANAARAQTAQPTPPVTAVHGRFLERYLAGEHEAVWAELVSLGPDVRKPQYFAEAVAVARETMRRARHNVELLIQRLDGMGYDFGEPNGRSRGRSRNHLKDHAVFLPPSFDEKAKLDALERDGSILPLSLRMWMEEVGRVDLCGSHPTLCFLEDGDGFPGVYADPLMVIPNADSIEDFLGIGETENDMFISYDDWGKAAIGRNEQIDSAYSMEVPNLATDGVLRGYSEEIYFVDYLRLNFRWGGFPGWKGQAQRPERELKSLADGLLAL